MSGAKDKLEGIKERIGPNSNLADDPHFDGWRDLVDAAIKSANGAPDKIQAMSETQGLLVAVLAHNAVREPDRMKSYFEAVHETVCPITPLIHTDADGRRRMPWENYDSGAVMGKQPHSNFPVMLYSILREKASLIIVCVTAIIIAAIAFDRLQKLSDAVNDVRNRNAATSAIAPYEAP